jgi:hypothetical protein
MEESLTLFEAGDEVVDVGLKGNWGSSEHGLSRRKG